MEEEEGGEEEGGRQLLSLPEDPKAMEEDMEEVQEDMEDILVEDILVEAIKEAMAVGQALMEVRLHKI